MIVLGTPLSDLLLRLAAEQNSDVHFVADAVTVGHYGRPLPLHDC